jgi:tetratricopeptide (TPR) repeat protein
MTWLLLWGTAMGTVNGQGTDVVLCRLSDGSKEITRRGTIVDWRGGRLEMEVDGRRVTIDNEQIRQVVTGWPADYELGQSLIREQQMGAAATPLINALQAESREWMQQWIRGDLIRCLHYAGRTLEACEQFIRLLEIDPESRDFGAIPLTWEDGESPAPVRALAQQMLRSSVPAIQLLGASHLVNSSDRAAALKQLEELSRDLDSRLAHLASAQLWRVKLVEITPDMLARWQRQWQRMPAELRSGPTLILGQAHLRLKNSADAQLLWMRLPILHPRDYRAAAFALHQTAACLHNEGQIAVADRLRRELKTQFPESPWAQTGEDSAGQSN